MTHTHQHTQSPEAPRGGRPRTRSVSLRTVVGSAGAVATVAAAAVLGVLTLAADDQNQPIGQPLAAEQDGSGATQGSVPTCSIWSVPTLEVAPVPQSSLTEGAPYVALCTDDGDEETTFVFLYGHANHTPTPRR